MREHGRRSLLPHAANHRRGRKNRSPSASPGNRVRTQPGRRAGAQPSRMGASARARRGHFRQDGRRSERRVPARRYGPPRHPESSHARRQCQLVRGSVRRRARRSCDLHGARRHRGTDAGGGSRAPRRLHPPRSPGVCRDFAAPAPHRGRDPGLCAHKFDSDGARRRYTPVRRGYPARDARRVRARAQARDDSEARQVRRARAYSRLGRAIRSSSPRRFAHAMEAAPSSSPRARRDAQSPRATPRFECPRSA